MSSGFPPSPANNPFGDFNNPYQSPAGNFGPGPTAPYGFQTPRDQALQMLRQRARAMDQWRESIITHVPQGTDLDSWGPVGEVLTGQRPALDVEHGLVLVALERVDEQVAVVRPGAEFRGGASDRAGDESGGGVEV